MRRFDTNLMYCLQLRERGALAEPQDRGMYMHICPRCICIYFPGMQNPSDLCCACPGAGSAQSTAKNNLLMQLRKCCAHPSLLSPSPGIEHGQALAEYVAASGKLALLDQMVRLQTFPQSSLKHMTWWHATNSGAIVWLSHRAVQSSVAQYACKCCRWGC